MSTVDALVTTLREQILSGEMSGGEPLREAELCDQFGVSRHSLRTAMRVLLASGLLVHQANRGVFVTSLTADDVHDIYALRRSLEIDAVMELVGRPDRQEVVLASLNRLESVSEEVPWAEVRDLDLQFHQSLVESLHRPRTTRVFLGLLDEVGLAFRQLKDELEVSELVARQHREIFEAVATGSSQLAADLMLKHLTSAEATICAAFGEASDQE